MLGIELWANDLLAVARGEVEWITLLNGHMRVWDMAPSTLGISTALFMVYFSALRRPDLFLRLYRHGLGRVGDAAPVVRAGRADVTVRSRV